MKNILSLSLIMLSFLSTFAQKSAVIAALNKQGIDTSILSAQSKQKPNDYSYDLKYTSIAENKETVTLANFNPSKPEAERWTVISIEGKTPSKSAIATFRKNHIKPSAAVSLPDESTYQVEKETADILVISYKLDARSIPAEASFMKDCRLHLNINLKTKKLEKIESLNEKPLKIKIFNAQKMDLVVTLGYNEAEQQYYTISEDLNLIIKFLGQLVPMETLSEYSNYKKI